MGTAGDILSSPSFWILTGICLSCGWWAKRSLVDGIILGGIAPLILVPVWFVVMFALGIPFFAINALAPGLLDSAVALYRDLPEALAFVLLPQTIITAILFLMFCHSERTSAGLPSGYRPRPSQTGDHNPFSRSFR